MADHTLKSTTHKSFESDITASVIQTQGSGQITAQFNRIIIVANTNDTITLPVPKEFDEIFIINDGVNDLQIFPVVGNNLGNGLNAPMILEAKERINFFANSETVWEIEYTTEIFHAEIHDEDNTDAFVISKVNENHCYHSNGIIIGDVGGWKFQNGETVPIASITDAGSGDITVETTGNHSLAVKDVISQNNITPTNAAYTKVFVVKSIVDSTHYTVTAVFTATATGTMNQAATLTCEPIAAGTYALTYDLSAIAETNNDIFKFFIYKNATKIPGTKRKKKFNLEGDVSKGAVTHIDSGDKISLVMKNTTSIGNITLEDYDKILMKL